MFGNSDIISPNDVANGVEERLRTESKWHPPSVSAVDGQDPKATAQIREYLIYFGDISESQHESSPDFSGDLKRLQRLGRISESGIYDEATARLMARPRCPHHSAREMTADSTSSNSIGSTFFVLDGISWDRTEITYRFDHVPDAFNGGDPYAAIRKAMNQWSNVSPMTFVEVSGNGQADIVISWTFGDRGDGNAFGIYDAWTYWGNSNPRHPTITMRFNEATVSNEIFVYQLALHEIGHALGLWHNDQTSPGPLAVMNQWLHGLNHLQSDDLAGIHSLYGWRTPQWELLDSYPATVSIHAASSGPNVSRLNDGLYQLHSDGLIWHWQGFWFRLDNNPSTRQISASGGQVYQRRSDGTVLQYTGTQRTTSWQVICNPGHTSDILAAGNKLYALRTSSSPLTPVGLTSIWQYTGTPITGWEQIGSGFFPQIAASTNGEVYQLVQGEVLRYDTTTSPPTWKTLDSNDRTTSIAAGGSNLYKLHDDGSVYSYDAALGLWSQIDNYPAIIEIFAAGNYMYLRHNTGFIWRYTGNPYSWERLDNNPHTVAIVGDDSGTVWQLQRDGANRAIYRLNS